MIILDTNIISELMKAIPNQQVTTWLDQHDPITLFTTSITVAEILYGISVLPEGKRQSDLKHAFNNVLFDAFQYRILTFDNSAAHLYGQLMGKRQNLGRPLSILDGQIAAIARANAMQLATRNTRDFIDCGLELINPLEI